MPLILELDFFEGSNEYSRIERGVGKGEDDMCTKQVHYELAPSKN